MDKTTTRMLFLFPALLSVVLFGYLSRSVEKKIALKNIVFGAGHIVILLLCFLLCIAVFSTPKTERRRGQFLDVNIIGFRWNTATTRARIRFIVSIAIQPSAGACVGLCGVIVALYYNGLPG